MKITDSGNQEITACGGLTYDRSSDAVLVMDEKKSPDFSGASSKQNECSLDFSPSRPEVLSDSSPPKITGVSVRRDRPGAPTRSEGSGQPACRMPGAAPSGRECSNIRLHRGKIPPRE